MATLLTPTGKEQRAVSRQGMEGKEQVENGKQGAGREWAEGTGQRAEHTGQSTPSPGQRAEHTEPGAAGSPSRHGRSADTRARPMGSGAPPAIPGAPNGGAAPALRPPRPMGAGAGSR